MKNALKFSLIIASALAISSCTKYKALDFEVEKPESITAQEDIDAYPALKSFINRTTNPKFRLGAALSLNGYTSRGVMYRLANRNFDEIVLGYEMKHGAIVQSNGSLALDNVTKLLQTAQQAGMSVYGHTLAWHANQNAGYLKSIIQPLVIPGVSVPSWDLVTGADFETNDASNYQVSDGTTVSFSAAGQGAGGVGRALIVNNPTKRTDDWRSQFFLAFSPAVKAGEQYELSMDVKADVVASFSTQAHVTPGNYKHWDFFGAVNATTTWTKFTKQITVSADMATSGAIAFNLGNTATNYYFDNITLKKYNEKGGGDAGFALTFTNPSVVNFWEAQTAYDFSPVLENNKEYTLKFAAKADKAGNIRAELQSTSDYSSNSFGAIPLTTAWKEYELKTTTNKADRNRFVISFGDFAGKVFIDNIKVTAAGSVTNLVKNSDFEASMDGWFGWGNGSTRVLSNNGQGFGGVGDQIIEKTPVQKDSILSAALEKFIGGLMTVAKPYVRAWDVVNEPMDDGKPFELKTAVGRTTIAADDFFWQDYLGKDYAVKAFKLARQYGNAGDTLFINDYNLEYNLDKCRGLIEYVKYIESKGVKVDGIGTQMHIDINANKENIAEMFKLLAATGKQVKISELDLGLGNVRTQNATAAQYQAQAEMYKYVIDKYFELVPAAQRYGITFWSPLDSPGNSSWRAGEPIGLWTETYVRKLAYSYVAEALKANAK